MAVEAIELELVVFAFVHQTIEQMVPFIVFILLTLTLLNLIILTFLLVLRVDPMVAIKLPLTSNFDILQVAFISPANCLLRKSIVFTSPFSVAYIIYIYIYVKKCFFFFFFHTNNTTSMFKRMIF